MLEKKCILLLYGEGRYDSSMGAIKEYVEANRRDAYVVAVSDEELYSFKRRKIAFFMYKICVRSFSSLVRNNTKLKSMICKLKLKKGKKRKIKEKDAPDSAIGEFIHSLSEKYRRIHNILVRYSPDVVVCASPRLLHDAIKAKHKAGMKNISISALITDYNLDIRFVDQRTNYYFVQNDAIASKLVEYGIERRKIKVSGTPISQSTMITHDRSEVLAELGIDNDNINVVLVSGRYGGNVIKKVVMSLIEMEYAMNIILITGSNDGLSKFADMLSKNNNRENSICIVEEIENMSKIYSIADILIAKPTATITYEALCHNTKLITCCGDNYIEDRNAHYLATKQLSLLGSNNNDLIESISNYLTNDELCDSIKSNQSEYIVYNADEVVSEILLQIADKNYKTKSQVVIDLNNKTAEMQKMMEKAGGVSDVMTIEENPTEVGESEVVKEINND